MAFKALDLGHVEEYVSPNDPDPSNPTVWLLGTISGRLQAIIKDGAAKFAADLDADGTPSNFKATVTPNQLALDTVMFGLRGWRNFPDKKGAEVQYKTEKRTLPGATVDVLARECIDRIDIVTVRELAERLEKINEVSEEDRKNSVG